MNVKKTLAMALAAVLLASFWGCTAKSAPTGTTTAPGGGAVVNSDSVITGQIKSITKESTGFPWQLDVLIDTSTDVGSLPNPTRDSVGKVITVKTDQDMTSFKAGDDITAKVKYVGDVPQPGITLYIYDIAKSQTTIPPPGY